MLVSRGPDALDGPAREQGAAGRGQVMDEPDLLPELRPHLAAARSGELRLVVVAVDAGRLAPVEQHVGALVQEPRRIGGIRLLARARQQDLLHVALGKRSLAGGHFHDRRLVL